MDARLASPGRVLGWLQPHRIVLIAIALALVVAAALLHALGLAAELLAAGARRASGARSGSSSSPPCSASSSPCRLVWRRRQGRAGSPGRRSPSARSSAARRCCCSSGCSTTGSVRCSRNIPGSGTPSSGPICGRHGPMRCFRCRFPSPAMKARSCAAPLPACRAASSRPARAFGMSRWKIFRRIWLPQAMQRALPTLAGETVLQLKSTPLVATITVIDLYAVASTRTAGHLHHLRAAAAAGADLYGHDRHPRVPVPQGGGAHSVAPGIEP